MNNIRENLLKEKSNGTFSFAGIDNLTWSDQIRFLVSPTTKVTDYEVTDHLGQIKLTQTINEKTTYLLFPRELSPLIVKQVMHYIELHKEKFRTIDNRLQRDKRSMEQRIREELNNTEKQFAECKKLLSLASSKIGLESADTFNEAISKLNVGIHNLAENHKEAKKKLKYLDPEKDMLFGSERDFYKHYKKMLEIRKIFN
ncbi:hypothetical protein P3646_18090 [Vibrio parahaemolyticus]|nr:hypothetical protein [Vibrio parahaemolyticus]